MTLLRELCLGNWRNKCVALFFAITIWFVVFQSEKQEWFLDMRVFLVPADAQGTIITEVKEQNPESKEWVNFDKYVTLHFSGPRKQIENLKQEVHLTPIPGRIAVPGDAEIYTFRPEDFGFPRDGIEVTQITPQSVGVTQDVAKTQLVSSLETYIEVVDLRDGYEFSVVSATPSEIMIRAPERILDRVKPNLRVSIGYGRLRFEGDVPVSLGYTDDIAHLVDTVDVEPAQVHLVVELKASTEVLEEREVPVTFPMPPTSAPVKILVDGISGRTIPLEFYGPKEQISRLAVQIQRADFSVAVRVPQNLELEPGKPIESTFSEDTLEWYGFPDIQVRPHKERPKVPWTYRLVPVKEEAPSE